MIDWRGVFANTLWIAGLAVLLAVWSLGYYEGQRSQRPVRRVLAQRGYALTLTSGWVLFCAGMAATESRLWARVLWGGLGVALLVERALEWRSVPASN